MHTWIYRSRPTVSAEACCLFITLMIIYLFYLFIMEIVRSTQLKTQKWKENRLYKPLSDT